MGEEYSGPVAFFDDPEAPGEPGYYVAMPEADWEAPTEGQEHLADPHPHSAITAEEMRSLQRVVWVADPSAVEQVTLPPQEVRADYVSAGEQIPEDQLTQRGNHKYYTIPERTTNVGGGHFELAGDQPAAQADAADDDGVLEEGSYSDSALD